LAERTSFDPKKPTEFFSQQVFAGGHDKVVVALMNGQVDAGAIFDDARDNKSLLQMWPNLMQETKVVAQTDSIPSDTVSVRKGLPKEMVDKLKAAFLKVGNSEEGRQLLREVLGTYGLTEATDADYDPVRRAAKVLNLNLEEELAKPR
jgi:phosphonate transport system substrate-binding protein